jgi:hypothetical protein
MRKIGAHLQINLEKRGRGQIELPAINRLALQKAGRSA